MLAFTRDPLIEVRLPPGDENTSTIHIQILIRDIYDCQTIFYIKSIIVISNFNFINQLTNSTEESIFNLSFSHLNTNQRTQTTFSLFKQMNLFNQEDLIDIDQSLCLFKYHWKYPHFF